MNNYSMNILVVEDEEKIMDVIKSYLESIGYKVISANNGKKALELFEMHNISLILLDLMLPEISGEEVCRLIQMKSRVPIIMVTAKSGEEDMINGLMELGADDYITKPFSLKTIRARVEAVLRRSKEDIVPEITKYNFNSGDLIINTESRSVYRQTEEIKLTSNEYKILLSLIKNPNKAFSREDLITSALGFGFDGYDRTIDSHIKNLRQKIENDPKNPVYVKTLHGFGYKFGIE